jgi:hypothetical protein
VVSAIVETAAPKIVAAGFFIGDVTVAVEVFVIFSQE